MMFEHCHPGVQLVSLALCCRRADLSLAGMELKRIELREAGYLFWSSIVQVRIQKRSTLAAVLVFWIRGSV